MKNLIAITGNLNSISIYSKQLSKQTICIKFLSILLLLIVFSFNSWGATPTVSSFTPTGGISGCTVSITGTNFTGATAVKFGGTAATSFSVTNSTTISAVVASGTTGVVSVTNASGTGSSSSTFNFYVPIDGEYRSAVTTGNWGDASTWQVRTNSSWAAAASAPTSINNVYIQEGHTITVDGATANCNDFHVNTSGVVSIGANTLQVSGKIRAYTGTAVISTGADGTFYSQSSSTSPVVGQLASTTGVLKFIGNTRTITASGEWGAGATTGVSFEFGLTSGQTGSINTSIKGKSILFSSGIINSVSSRFAPDDNTTGGGTLTINSGATVITSQSGTSSGSQVISRVGSGKCSSVTVQSGGTLVLTGSTPTIDATTITLNGTVQYDRAGTQTFLKKSSQDNTASDITTYNNVIISNTSAKTLAVSTTINGTLSIQGTASVALSTFSLTYGSSSTLEYATTAGVTATANEFPASNSPANLKINTSGQTFILPASFSRTLTGDINLANGTLADGGNTITIGGNILGSGTHTGAGKISMTGSGKTISGATLTNLELNNSGGFSLSGSPTLNGTLTLTAGNLTIWSNTLTLIGPAIAGSTTNLLADGTSSIVIGGSSSGVNIPSSVTSLNNFTLNNTNGTSLQAGLTVGGLLTLSSGALVTGINTLTLKGAISGSGTINTSTTGTLAFGGSSEQSLVASNLTSGAVNILTVNAGAKLTTTGTITASTLNILNDGTTAGTGTLKDVGGTLTATNTNVSQFLTGGRNWYLSSPVTGATGSGVLTTSTATTAPAYFAWYDETKGSATGWTTESSTLLPAKGYVAVYKASQNATPSTDGTITFSGTLNTGTKSVDLTSSSADYIGYNLVGNPFPAYLNISSLSSNSNVVSSYWYRTYASGGYVFDSENLPSGLGTSLSGLQMTGKVPPLQAFWLKANNATTLSFSSANCVHQDNSNNKFRAPSTASATQQVLRLQVSNGTTSDEAIIYSNAAALNSYDAYDTPKISNNNASIPEIYTTVNGQNLVINGLNNIPLDTELPLGFSTGQQNTFSIKASELNNFVAGTRVILKDYLDSNNPVIADLSDGSSYVFSSGVSSNNTSRFALIFKAPSITTGINPTDNSSFWISTNANGQIMLNGTPNAETSIAVYNAIGQRMAAKNLSSTINVLDTRLVPGVYTIVLKSPGKTATTKVIIK